MSTLLLVYVLNGPPVVARAADPECDWLLSAARIEWMSLPQLMRRGRCLRGEPARRPGEEP